MPKVAGPPSRVQQETALVHKDEVSQTLPFQGARPHPSVTQWGPLLELAEPSIGVQQQISQVVVDEEVARTLQRALEEVTLTFRQIDESDEEMEDVTKGKGKAKAKLREKTVRRQREESNEELEEAKKGKSRAKPKPKKMVTKQREESEADSDVPKLAKPKKKMITRQREESEGLDVL